jgi:hypothetical protein
MNGIYERKKRILVDLRGVASGMLELPYRYAPQLQGTALGDDTDTLLSQLMGALARLEDL